MNKRSSLKNLILMILATYCISFGIGRVFLHRNSPFLWTCDISSHFAFNPNWEVPHPTDEEVAQLQTLMQQKFTYLNCGVQSLAFLSEDGQFVLKFFKLNRRRLPLFARAMPLPSFLSKVRERLAEGKQKKLDRDFGSYVLAYNLLKEEAALQFLHLNKTNYLKQSVRIIDRVGIPHTIDLDETPFLVQRKVSLPYETIDQLMKHGELDAAKMRIASLLDLTLCRYKKGIFDDDPQICTNYGFEGEKAIFLDIGRMEYRPEFQQPEIYRQDFEIMTNVMRDWLLEYHPSLVPYLDEKKNEACYFE